MVSGRYGSQWLCGLDQADGTRVHRDRRATGGNHPRRMVTSTTLARCCPFSTAGDVPVFAHPLERPYLTGRSPYPPPDPLSGGGSMSLLSRLYPRGPINVGDRLEFLQEDGYIPFAPSWRWIMTPGHSPGHISLFRDADRTLIAGDAVVTTKQESLIAVATQRREIHGPPSYFTQDWGAAGDSVGRLAALEPEVLATGHGEPLADRTCAATCEHWPRGLTSWKYPGWVATRRSRRSPMNGASSGSRRIRCRSCWQAPLSPASSLWRWHARTGACDPVSRVRVLAPISSERVGGPEHDLADVIA